jgi:hypothetical protein
MKNCTVCDGTGRSKYYNRQCYSCHGRGTFPPPDVSAIRAAVRGRKGLRTSSRGLDPRAYYVWRMARFHGGADMSMPVMAATLIHGDPYVEELDVLADALAREHYGSDMRAALRWGRALGMI